MTIRLVPRAVLVTLLIYSFILLGNMAVLWVIGHSVGRDLAEPGVITAIDALVGLLALALVVIVLHAFAALSMARVSADAERVWAPRPLGTREVRRSELAAIRQARLTQPLAKGTKVWQFVRRDGSVAFHIQKGVYSADEVLALGNYLQVPVEEGERSSQATTQG